MSIKAYKVFNPDWTCRGFKYKVGETYKHEGEIIPCESGFHFCQNISDCFNYYRFCSDNRVAEVEALGNIKIDGDKSVTDEISIVRELSWHEVLDLCNSGKCCTGRRNSGDHNSGDRNSGDWNSGDWNSGYRNSGNRNSGNRNSGNRNSGNYNSGDYNSGDRNSGDYNSGDHNSGDWNSGDWNSGNYNSGYRNSGNYNSGYYNSGDRNSGDWNSGNYNSGDHNSGDWNSTNYSTGFFNSVEQPIYIFNKPTNLSRIEIYNLPVLKSMRVKFIDTLWINSDEMSEVEKLRHPEHNTAGGYLKTLSFKEACGLMWNNMTTDEKAAVKDIPNFDAVVFEEITGIKVD